MNYISDFNKLNKIKEKASNGDEKAKDFLFGFMDMCDEEANEYLSTIDDDKTEFSKVISALVKDENEAIDGYDKAIKFISNSNEMKQSEKSKILARLEEIKRDEIEHIKELKEIL